MVIVIGRRIGDSREEGGREGEALGREAAEKQAGPLTNIASSTRDEGMIAVIPGKRKRLISGTATMPLPITGIG